MVMRRVRVIGLPRPNSEPRQVNYIEGEVEIVLELKQLDDVYTEKKFQ